MTKSQLSKALIAACSLFILAGCNSQIPAVISDSECPLLPSDPAFEVNSDLATWQNYTDPQYGFSIKIPANYVIELSTAPNKGDYLDYYDIRSAQQYKLGNECTFLNYASIIVSKADESIGRQELTGGTEFRGGTSYYASDQNYAYEIREFTDNATFAEFTKTLALPAKSFSTFTPPHNNESQGLPLGLGPVGEKNVSKKVEVIKSLTYTYLTFKPAGSDFTRSLLDITEEGGIDKKHSSSITKARLPTISI